MAYAEALTIQQDESEIPPIAILRLTESEIFFCWLPALFLSEALQDHLRAAIVKRLRLEATRLETGDVDRELRKLMKES